MLIVFNKINAADKLGLPSPPPYLSIPKSDYKKIILTGVSFASGGSGILSGSYDTPVRFLFFTENHDCMLNMCRNFIYTAPKYVLKECWYTNDRNGAFPCQNK